MKIKEYYSDVKRIKNGHEIYDTPVWIKIQLPDGTMSIAQIHLAMSPDTRKRMHETFSRPYADINFTSVTGSVVFYIDAPKDMMASPLVFDVHDITQFKPEPDNKDMYNGIWERRMKRELKDLAASIRMNGGYSSVAEDFDGFLEQLGPTFNCYDLRYSLNRFSDAKGEHYRLYAAKNNILVSYSSRSVADDQYGYPSIQGYNIEYKE